MASQHHVEITFPSDLLFVAPTRAFIVRLAQRLGFEPGRVEDIELVIDEVCNNAVEHGSGKPDACVVTQVRMSDADLHVLVRDCGSYEYAHWLSGERMGEVRRAMSPDAERGHGIFLMETLADELLFGANELGGTDVSLTFRLSEPKDGTS